ncbi:antibiotic biosynthesis monooxygenase family protein [Sporosarcina beigongshangi]|uniref:antibiotic biosynthesis monooxygenase family protein n=1 Tax=Sporosarcina beigongshangi TaxID=2782538 RepID=UPI00193A9E8C|nr:antibiotic biosynthesis monooxygenase [Sporosarcina beigongshangi]
MYIFTTSGTTTFMESLRDKHPHERMIAMQAGANSLLLHETAGKTVFQTPRRYEVIGSSGALNDVGYFVWNHIPVTDEGRPIFEHHFKERTHTLDTEPGFIAFRLLRPLNSDTYIVMTEWAANTYYTRWKNAAPHHEEYLSGHAIAGVDSNPHIFTSAASVTSYIAKSKEDDV